MTYLIKKTDDIKDIKSHIKNNEMIYCFKTKNTFAISSTIIGCNEIDKIEQFNKDHVQNSLMTSIQIYDWIKSFNKK